MLCDQADYEWACKIITERKLNTYAHILFSPSWGQLDPSLLANWILRDRLSVRFQLQLHKILWNDARGH